MSVHNSLVCSPILKWGTDEQKKEWLPKLATGEVLGAYALTEPGSGSDAAALATSEISQPPTGFATSWPPTAF